MGFGQNQVSFWKLLREARQVNTKWNPSSKKSKENAQFKTWRGWWRNTEDKFMKNRSFYQMSKDWLSQENGTLGPDPLYEDMRCKQSTQLLFNYTIYGVTVCFIIKASWFSSTFLLILIILLPWVTFILAFHITMNF